MARLGKTNIPEIDQFFYPVNAGIPIAQTLPATPAANGAETDQAKAEGVFLFSEWLKRAMPEIYRTMLQTVPEDLIPEFALAGMGLSGLAEDPANPSQPSTSWGDRVFKLVETILPQYAQYRAQQELLKVNIARAERGLSPIEQAELAPQVRVGLTSDVQRLLIYGGIGLAVFLALRRR
jgi:hypothetical protein